MPTDLCGSWAAVMRGYCFPLHSQSLYGQQTLTRQVFATRASPRPRLPSAADSGRRQSAGFRPLPAASSLGVTPGFPFGPRDPPHKSPVSCGTPFLRTARSLNFPTLLAESPDSFLQGSQATPSLSPGRGWAAAPRGVSRPSPEGAPSVVTGSSPAVPRPPSPFSVPQCRAPPLTTRCRPSPPGTALIEPHRRVPPLTARSCPQHDVSFSAPSRPSRLLLSPKPGPPRLPQVPHRPVPPFIARSRPLFL